MKFSVLVLLFFPFVIFSHDVFAHKPMGKKLGDLNPNQSLDINFVKHRSSDEDIASKPPVNNEFLRRSVKELKAGFAPHLNHLKERVLITAALAAVVSGGIYAEKNLNDTKYFARTVATLGAWPLVASVLNHGRLFKSRLKQQDWHPSVFFYLVGGGVPLMAHSLLHTILITELFDFHLFESLLELAENSEFFEKLGFSHLELEAGHHHDHGHHGHHSGEGFVHPAWLPEGSIQESAMIATIASHDLIWINYRGAMKALAERRFVDLALMGHAHEDCELGGEHCEHPQD